MKKFKETQDTLSNLTKLNMIDDETLFRVGKSAQIAQIIIDTHKDIADILANPNCHLMEKQGKAYDLAFERGAEIQRISNLKYTVSRTSIEPDETEEKIKFKEIKGDWKK